MLCNLSLPFLTNNATDFYIIMKYENYGGFLKKGKILFWKLNQMKIFYLDLNNFSFRRHNDFKSYYF